MADVITRLKLESAEFDSKIKRATQGLLQMEQDCRKVGGTLGILEQDQKKFVQSLGQMQTVSTTVRGKIGELSSAYTELSVQYKRLTDEEKQGDYGRALTASLEQLKTRIAESKAQLAEVNSELGNTSRTGGETGGVLDQLAGKFSQNIAKLTSLGAALAAGKAALDVAKDAFFASEASVDEWGRTMNASKSLYEGFLTALNTVDISGYMSNMNAIVEAARIAYNELDRLGTMKTIQAPQISAQETENTRLRMMIQTGRYIPSLSGKIDVFNGQRLQEGQLLTPDQIRRFEGQLQTGVKTVVGLVGNEVKQTGKAIEAVYNSQSKDLGMSLAEFKKGTSSMAEFDKRMAGYAKYQEYQAKDQAALAKSGSQGGWVSDKNNPYLEYEKWGVFRVDGDRYNQLVQLIQQRDQQASAAYGKQGQAYRAINRAEGVTVSQIMRGGGGGGSTTTKVPRGGGGSSVVKTEEQLNDEKIRSLTAEYVRATDERRTAIQSEIKGLQERNAEIQRLKDEATGKIKVFEPGTMEFYQDSLKTLQKELLTLREKGADPIEIDFKTDEIKDVQKEIDRLNGKVTVEVELKRPPSIEEQLRTEISDQNVAADEASLRSLMKTTIANNIDGIDFTAVREKMVEGLNIPDEEWQTIVDAINEKLVAMDLEPIKLNFETGSVSKEGKAVTDSWMSAAQAVQSVGQAMQQIEDPVAKVAGIVAQAVATIALSFSKSLLNTHDPWSWIAAAAAGTATMVSTIAAIKSATSTQKFANGGIVQGNTYSGDQIDIKANAGEVVLTRAQQGNLAEQLSGGGIGNMQLEARVSAEDLIFVLNNNGLRRGYGKYIKD